MTFADTIAIRRTRFLDRVHATLARREEPARGFVSQPEPHTIGSPARGRQLIAGNLMFAGFLIEAPDPLLWDVTAPSAAFDAERHGFGWLDDLAAVGDAAARVRAQRWTWGWIEAHGRGQGAGWQADLTGRRVIRWINHAIFLLRGQPPEAQAAFFRALARQARFLARRWRGAAPGLAQVEALTGLLYAGLTLEGKEALADPALRALVAACREQIDASGGLPTRNPEDLLEVFALLTWAAAALAAAGRAVPAPLSEAMARIAPTLRALRHADGGLARFHGGGRGIEGRLDQALAESRIRPTLRDRPQGLAMGYARLHAGRTSVIVDAAPPPSGAASVDAHASTLAFELTSARRPLIVSCGAGRAFGAEWRRAARGTPSHSALTIEGRSSARLVETRAGRGAALLVDGPADVPAELRDADGGPLLEAAQDGFVARYGLTHARTFELSRDGRRLDCSEILIALDDAAKRRFDARMDDASLSGIGFEIRLHLHPDVDAALALGGAAVAMALRSGEDWLFRYEGRVGLSLEPSVFLEYGRLKPRTTQQIVLSGRAIDYVTRVRWSLAKTDETAVAVRDLNRDDPIPED